MPSSVVDDTDDDDDNDISFQSKPSRTNRISSRNGSRPNWTNLVTLGRIDIQAKMKCSARDGVVGSTTPKEDDVTRWWCSSEAFSFSRGGILVLLGVPVWAEGVVVVGDDDAPPRVSPFERVGKDDIFDAFDDKDDDDAFGRPDDDIVVLLWTISLSFSLSLSLSLSLFVFDTDDF